MCGSLLELTGVRIAFGNGWRQHGYGVWFHILEYTREIKRDRAS